MGQVLGPDYLSLSFQLLLSWNDSKTKLKSLFATSNAKINKCLFGKI